MRAPSLPWNIMHLFRASAPVLLVFFILLHISLRKFRAVLLPRGSLGIEGLEIFLSPDRETCEEFEIFQVPIEAHRGARPIEDLEILLSPYKGL